MGLLFSQGLFFNAFSRGGTSTVAVSILIAKSPTNPKNYRLKKPAILSNRVPRLAVVLSIILQFLLSRE